MHHTTVFLAQPQGFWVVICSLLSSYNPCQEVDSAPQVLLFFPTNVGKIISITETGWFLSCSVSLQLWNIMPRSETILFFFDSHNSLDFVFCCISSFRNLLNTHVHSHLSAQSSPRQKTQRPPLASPFPPSNRGYSLGRFALGSLPSLFGLFLSSAITVLSTIWGTFTYILQGAAPLIAVWAPHLPFLFRQRWATVYPSFACPPHLAGPLCCLFCRRAGSCRTPFLLCLPFGLYSIARWLFSIQ